MMVGSRYYSDADMMRMQRDAEDRVREMRNRVRQTSDTDEDDGPSIPSFASPNRNWNQNPNTQRNRGRNNNGRRTNREQSTARGAERENPSREAERPHEDEGFHRPHPGSVPGADIPPVESAAEGGKQGTTLLEDVISSIGVEGDTLLIIGLILILINQKADATLILALAYLLI